VNRDATIGRCRACAHFRNSPAFLESLFPGMSALSSAWGSTRAEDGLCLKHDRYLSADSGCNDFTPAGSPADAPER
jgi:hypothetical protein